MVKLNFISALIWRCDGLSKQLKKSLIFLVHFFTTISFIIDYSTNVFCQSVDNPLLNKMPKKRKKKVMSQSQFHKVQVDVFNSPVLSKQQCKKKKNEDI